MRRALAMAGIVALAGACGGGSTTTASSTGAGATGTGTGTGGATSSGSTGGGLAAGTPCTSDDACASGVCGIDGGGNCCKAQCMLGPICGATACDSQGSCVYPAAGGTCAPSSCADAGLVQHLCDGFGECFQLSPAACPNNLGCTSDGTACNTTCTTAADCVPGFYCNAGSCAAKVANGGGCSENDACVSGICGVDGGGNCCAIACTNLTPPCGAIGCDPTGACSYPGHTVVCGPGGTETCSNGVQDNPNVTCDGLGHCPAEQQACDPFTCDTNACFASCSDDSHCASDGYCNLDAGACEPKLFHGACFSNNACESGVCGVTGVGNCCAAACTDVTPPCGATDCDSTFGACSFPTSSTACGSIPASCTGTTQTNPSACDGFGNCIFDAGTSDCLPFVCGATACFTSCSDNSSCASGDVCDTAVASCCVPLADGDVISVDGVLGSDSSACCGYGGAGSCKTISHAMALIDASQAKNVTIAASIGGLGGDWPNGAEIYPIRLGWGAELNAPGVYFLDRNGQNPEIIDVAAYSANDTVGYASIVGTSASPIGVGMSAAGTNQLSDTAAISIEAGQTLYLANAVANGSGLNGSTAIVVQAGGGLLLGADQSGQVTGTVTIGNADNKVFTAGWDGIVCNTAGSQGCAIMDADLVGQSSVVIEGQEDVDIYAQDYATITLTSAPVIGVPPAKQGFNQCPASGAGTTASPDGKPDVSSGKSQAIRLEGNVTMTFNGGTVQCISGAGIKLVTSPNGNGNPVLNMDGTLIQNTELGVFASAGTANITNSTIAFNYNGVEASGDGTNLGTINLGGSADGGVNTVICSQSGESIDATPAKPGVDVLNDTSAALDADNVAWDTATPDVFDCDAATLKTCTCDVASCSNKGGVDDMDAVNDAKGSISTNGATQSPTAVTAKCD